MLKILEPIRALRSGAPRAALVLAALLLSGCVSTISARVTSYQRWPGNVQGQTYRIVPDAAQRNNLQYQSFADMLRAAIGPTGLVESHTSSARFDVGFTYSSAPMQAWVQRFAPAPYYYSGPGWGGYWGGYYGPWGPGYYGGAAVVDVPVPAYRNTLTVTIKDKSNHDAEVYRSSAVSVSGGNDLQMLMPYLARAVFDGFPGNNGQVRDINYPMDNY
ncbi:DUF4136 domain-containing protein [Candidimonas nitroreducens]|uniref:DUF4136 domain-containing protein n=1 Tax=Candidimonas nitroreducens TaxID=683354 RepID=A0A225M3G2_9BURK|nr:DUF4136 domain-containing protein [Candidimonas nitroreducens]OWT55676.1 hypothetical protein CEY11_20350 [Candidimonas nitroreducens]